MKGMPQVKQPTWKLRLLASKTMPYRTRTVSCTDFPSLSGACCDSPGNRILQALCYISSFVQDKVAAAPSLRCGVAAVCACPCMKFVSKLAMQARAYVQAAIVRSD